MIRLAQTPVFAPGALPVTIGDVSLTQMSAATATTIAPFRGQEQAVNAAMQAAIGIGLPAAGRVESGDNRRAIWAGSGQTLMLGAALPADLLSQLAPLAAVTDQSGAQTLLCITGDAAEAVLARLVAVDLRQPQFAIGHVALCDIGHMPGMVLRRLSRGFILITMRSMAKTLLHELTEAATRVNT